MFTSQALQEAREMATDLHTAQTLADLDNLYFDWIGYSIIEDDPECTFEYVNDILQGYLREFCDSTGVPYILALCEPSEVTGFVPFTNQ